MDEIEEKRLAQQKYAKEKKLPLFAPLSGKCWSCGRNIYNAISLEEASTRLITGCPYCHRTYCD